MTLYRVLLFVHVLAAAAWVGGGIFSFAMAWRLRGTNDPARMGAFGREMGEFGALYFAPAAIVTVVFGVWLVLEGDIGFDHFWILSAIAVWLYSLVSNVTWLAKLSDRIVALSSAEPPAPAEARAAGAEMFRWRALEVATLVYVIFAMTYKPFV